MKKFSVYFRGHFTVAAKDSEEANMKAQEELVGNPLNFDFWIYDVNKDVC